MTVQEFIYEELIATGKAEIYNGYAEPEISRVMARYATLLGPKYSGEYVRILIMLRNDPDMSRLENVMFMLSQLENVKQGRFSSEAYSMIQVKMKEDPSNKLFQYLWTQFRVRYYTKEEYDAEMAFFLDDVFSNYPHLVQLDDFFQNNLYFLPDPELIKKYAKLLLPVFSEAALAFRGKYILQYYLLLCYSYSGDYEKAYYIYKYLLKKQLYFFRSFLEINNDHYTWFTFSRAIYVIAKNLEIQGQYTKMVEIINDVIKIYFRDEKAISKKSTKEHGPFCYFNFVFWRMRANLLLGKRKDVLFDYSRIASSINNDIDPFYWKDLFSDVLDYIKSHET